MLKCLYKVLGLFTLFLASVAHSFEMDEQMRVYLNEARLIEGGFPSGLSEDMSLPFADYMSDHWKEIIDQIEEIAPTEREQEIISVTAELMPSHKYLDFVMAFLKKCEEGVVHRSVVANRTLSPGALRYGFFEYNFNHPKVREVLSYGKKLFIDDENLNRKLDNILSGVGKERVDDWLSMTGKSAPELIDVNKDSTDNYLTDEQTLIVTSKETLREDSEVEQRENDFFSKVTDLTEEPAKKSSTWWLWLIGAVIVVGGIVLLRRKK